MGLRESKSGKTIGAATAPGGLLFFNTDIGNATRQVHVRNPDGRIREPFIPPYAEEEHKAVPIILPLMGEVYREAVSDQIESVVVDPVGELYRRLLDEQSGRAINLGKNSLQIRLAVTTYIERFCRSLVEAPVNAVFVCHELPVKDEETESFERLPFTGTTNPNLGQKIMGMVDIVGYTGVKVEEDGSKRYMAQLVPGFGRRGGDRFDCLGDSRDLNIAEWIDTIKQSESVPTKAKTTRKAEAVAV